MQTALKILSLVGKGLGLVVAMDWTAISPSKGALIFFIASIVKDTVNRVGDYLDDQKVNNSFNP